MMIARGNAANRAGTWQFVIIDTCKSSAFARLLLRDLSGPHNELGDYLILGVSGSGHTNLGLLRKNLSAAIDVHFGGVETIEVGRLGDALADRLTGCFPARVGMSSATLSRPRQLVGITMDIRAELQPIVENLGADELRHFIPKAQSAEITELLWFFEGRTREAGQIVDWLARASHGMLVVTGPVGCGKSALLGQVLTYSRHELRDLLLNRRLITKPMPALMELPNRTIDAAVLLTGATAMTVVARLVHELELGPPPGAVDVNRQVDDLLRLVDGFVERWRRPIVLLFDALDEAADPMRIARQILVPLSQLAQVRVVVGTRRSTREGPDLPEAGDQDIIDTLRPGDDGTVTLEYERDAVSSYIRNRLRNGLPPEVVNGADGSAIRLAADMLAYQRREFLYARLLVHELLADPGLLRSGRADELFALVSRDYRHLFTAAVDRLTSLDTVNRDLLEALAVAEGRGLPVLDRTWAVVASAGTGRVAGVDHIDTLLRVAAPYILLDTEDGQAVYRLAHRTFAELLAPADPAAHHAAVVRALLGAVPIWSGLNPYVTRHLAGHAMRAPAAWPLIADRTDVLDQLDPLSVTVGALGAGIRTVPLEIAGVATMGDQLTGLSSADRPGWRQVGMAQHGDPPRRRDATRAWALRWCALTGTVPQFIIGRQTGPVQAVAAMPGEPESIISAGDDRLLHLWEPVPSAWSGEQQISLGGNRILAVTTLTVPDGGTLVVAGGSDGVLRFRNPADGAGSEVRAHDLGVLCLAAVPHPHTGDMAVVSGGQDGLLRLWDPVAATPIGEPWSGHARGGVSCLATVPWADGTSRVVSGGTDGTLRLWDTASGTQQHFWRAHRRGGVTAVTSVRLGGAVAVASGGNDRAIRLWDPVSGTQRGEDWIDPESGTVQAITELPWPAGAGLVVSGDSDGTLRFWHAATATMIAIQRDVHVDDVRSLATLTSEGRGAQVISGGDDGTVRLWDLTSVARNAQHTTATEVLSLAEVGSPGGRRLAVSGGTDGLLRCWDPATAEQVGPSWAGHEQGVQVLRRVVLADGRQAVVSGGLDRTLRLWDPATGRQIGHPWTGHGSYVTAIEAVPHAGGGIDVISGSADYTLVRWDPERGTPVGEPWLGHMGIVWAITWFQGRDGQPLVVSGGGDGTVRLWDPRTGVQRGPSWLGHGDWVRAVVTLPGPDGTTLVASADDGGTIIVWDPAAGVPVTEPWRTRSGILVMEALPEPIEDMSLVYVNDNNTAHICDPFSRRRGRTAALLHRVHDLAIVDGAIAAATDSGILAIDLQARANGEPSARDS
jgi:WD40 repeat protein